MAAVGKKAAAGVSLMFFAGAALLARPASAEFGVLPNYGSGHAMRPLADRVVYDYPPGYVGYLCAIPRPCYDAFGNLTGYENVVVPC